jgi:ribosomal protein S18 acetylase RimI-like enzyme
MARAGLIDARGGQLRLRECDEITDWPSLFADANTFVLVGTLLDVVLGYMVLLIRADLDRGVITHAFVEEGARELGLGDTMVEHAIAHVRDAQLSGIEAVALPGDRETKNLFERAGLTARKITVYKSLVPRDAS